MAPGPGKVLTGTACNRLHDKGSISDPVGKAKSVVLTDEGLLALIQASQERNRASDALKNSDASDVVVGCGCTLSERDAEQLSFVSDRLTRNNLRRQPRDLSPRGHAVHSNHFQMRLQNGNCLVDVELRVTIFGWLLPRTCEEPCGDPLPHA